MVFVSRDNCGRRGRKILLVTTLLVLIATTTSNAEEVRWAIALHGGAGSLPKDVSQERLQVYKAALNRALQAGEKILSEGGTALDAVEQTVMLLEDAPCFNAGRGGTFNEAGYHQLDASIMSGQALACGGVSAVQHVRNPIRAARLVMEKTPHVLLTGADADEFAKSNQLEMVSQGYFFDATRWEQFLKSQQKLGKPVLTEPPYELPKMSQSKADLSDLDISRGTVGCVALDQHGNLAAATSTGGVTSKMRGRVGDTPIIGAGTYADNNGCAVSGTGQGEEYIRHAIAFQVNWRVRENHQPLEAAVRDCLEKVLKPGDGGMIAVDRKGNIATLTNTKSMHCGWSDSTGKRGIGFWEPSIVK